MTVKNRIRLAVEPHPHTLPSREFDVWVLVHLMVDAGADPTAATVTTLELAQIAGDDPEHRGRSGVSLRLTHD